jgi:beta-glucosidase
LHVDKESIAANENVTVSVSVANNGPVAADEVVQLYLSHPGIAGVPLRALEGFQRVHLERGQHKMISFTLHDRDLSTVDEAGKRRIASGTVKVWVGGGQPTVRPGLPETAGVSTQFSITSEAQLPD